MKELKAKSGIAFLGAGGKSPRVDALETESMEICASIPFTPMHSVYAIDVDWQEQMLFVATKGGWIHVFDRFPCNGFEQRLISMHLQGAPMLSISHLIKTKLAASDIARRCLVWQAGKTDLPIALDTKGEEVCALLPFSENQLTGLSSEGTFFIWDLSGPELIHSRQVCPPPPVASLVRTVFWRAAEVIVFPGQNGNLVLYDPQRDHVKEVNAHDGTFYALCLLGEALLTIGMKDGSLKLWMPDSEKPYRKLPVPDGVLCASHLGGLKPRILLVDAKGKAQAYSMEEDSMLYDRHLVGNGYRVSVSPPPEIMEAYDAAIRHRHAYEIWAKLENPDRQDQQITDMYLSTLAELGYEHVALATQADKTEKEGNVIRCLRLRAALADILPKSPEVCLSLEKYAASLDKVWLLREAENTCNRILKIDPHYSFSLDFNRISRISELMKTDSWVIEPDIPTTTIVDACNAVGQSFFGRYLIHKLPSLHCRQTILNCETIIAGYHEVRKKSMQNNLPSAEAEKFWWISRDETQEIEIVAFGKTPLNNAKGLCFALQVWAHAQGTVLVPVILFYWHNHDPLDDSDRAEEAGEDPSKALKRLTHSTSSSYVMEIQRVVNHALRQLITKSSRRLRT